MAAPENAVETVNLWQNLGASFAVFVAVGAAIVTRILSKRNDTEEAGSSGKHVVLEQATLSDAAPFIAMGKDVSAIRALLEEQVELQEEQRERQERDKVKERLDAAEVDRRAMMEMIQKLVDGGAKMKSGRPLVDE